MSSMPSIVMIRRAEGLSERMMTGQPPGAKHVAIASARTPAQSRNVTPGQVQDKPLDPVIEDPCRLLKELASRQEVRRAAQDERADRSITDRFDRQIISIHRFSIGSRGLDDTN
jgi:hypothetical protein